MTAIEEENNVLQKAKTIVSLEKSMKDKSDKTYIASIKYLFTKEFTETSLSLPTRKKEKESFQYLKAYVDTLDILFKKKEKERHKLYLSEISSKALGNDLFNLMQNLKTFSNRKNLGNFEYSNLVDLNVSVNYVICNYLKSMDNTLAGALNLYFYYLGYFIKSVDTFNYILYYFLQLNDVLRKLEYNDFCPDLKSSNCLNLILLFFESVVKESMEMLTIYAFLIFKYKYIFQGINDGIEKSILKKSVEETVDIVKEKTLNNKIILEYIFRDFIVKLNMNTVYPQNNNEHKKEENKIEETNKDYQEEVAKNVEENKIIDNKENQNNIIEESIPNKNELTSSINITGIINNNKDKSQINISINEENSKEGQSQLEENIIVNVKENYSSKIIENNNSSVNGTKDNSISNQSINEKNGNSYFDKTSDNNKSDKSDIIEESNVKNIINFENEFNKSPDIQKLMDEINKMKKENNEKFKDTEKRFKDAEKRIEQLENENNILKTEISKTKAKLDEVTKTLGDIQLRDIAKNFLKSFNIQLDKKDEETIKQNKKMKWHIISEKIKEEYKKYENSAKYEAFIEIVEKSAETVDKGNQFAHKINIEYYENNIDRFTQDNKIKIINPIKMFFLLQIKVSENCLLNGYELLDLFYENDMTRAFTRSMSLEQFFNKV